MGYASLHPSYLSFILDSRPRGYPYSPVGWVEHGATHRGKPKPRQILDPRFPRSRSQILKNERGIWQRRYWEHTLRDEKDYRAHMDYIHYNPAQHGYVDRVADWPHSTFHRYVEAGIYPRDWTGSGETMKEEFGEAWDRPNDGLRYAPPILPKTLEA